MEWLTRLRPGEEYYLQVSVEASVKKLANFAVGVSKMNNNKINNQVPNKIKIAVRNFVTKGAYISMTKVWLMYDVINLL